MRRWLLLLAMGLASIVVALGLAEGLLRVREYAAPAVAPIASAPAGIPVLRTVRELMQPNVNGFYRGTPYRTNHLGLRGPEIADRAAPGVVRIGLIGDSFTAGVSVPADRIYAGRLQEMLNAPDPGRFEVFNLGVPGASLGGSVKRFARIGLRLEPRIVVYGFTINDIEGPNYRRTRRDKVEGASPIHECILRAPLRVVRLICAGVNAAQDALLPDPDSYLAEIRFNYLENEAAWSDFVNQIEALKSLTKPRGICPVILIHEQLQGRKWPRPQRAIFDRVVAAAKSHGFTVADSRTAFHGIPFEHVRLGDFDPHPNASGHEILAETLYREIANLPERCHRPMSDS